MNRSEEIRIMSLPKMQEKFREAMGPLQNGDVVYLYDKLDRDKYSGRYYSAWKTETPGYYKFIDLRNNLLTFVRQEGGLLHGMMLRLPLPIDPVNPERGLWGMVDWRRFHVEDSLNYDGMLTIFERASCGTFTFNGTPTLALLKALAHQRGIDLEEK